MQYDTFIDESAGPHRPTKKPPTRQNYLTAVRAVLISVRRYVANNMKNVSSLCSASDVTVNVT